MVINLNIRLGAEGLEKSKISFSLELLYKKNKRIIFVPCFFKFLYEANFDRCRSAEAAEEGN